MYQKTYLAWETMVRVRTNLDSTKLSVWPLAPVEAGPLTTRYDLSGNPQYEHSNHYGELYPSGTYESLYTTASLSFMRSVASRATASHAVANDFPGFTGNAVEIWVFTARCQGRSPG